TEEPPPSVTELPATRSGRNVPAVPRATSATAAAKLGVSGVPVAKMKLPDTESPSKMWELVPVVSQVLSLPKGSSYRYVPVTLCRTSRLEFPSSADRSCQFCATTVEIPPSAPALSIECEY